MISSTADTAAMPMPTPISAPATTTPGRLSATTDTAGDERTERGVTARPSPATTAVAPAAPPSAGSASAKSTEVDRGRHEVETGRERARSPRGPGSTA